MPQALPLVALALHAVEGVAWVNALAQAATIASITAGVNEVVRNNTKPREQGGLINLELNPSPPRRLIIGKRAVGGTLVDWYLGGSNNVKLYLPVYLSEGPCGTITKIWAGGRVVHSTPLVHGVRTTIPSFRSGGDRLWMTYYDGRVGQTADATLVALPGSVWSSANKLTGCSWVLVECQWDSDNLRTPPTFLFEHEGAKFYDRRKDSTSGGSGTHRLNDPATWELGDAEGVNPMVSLDHFQLGRYWGSQRVFGIGMDIADIPYSRFAAQANICDENVTLKAGGTQKRYRANAVIYANEQYDDIIKRHCVAMAARPADFGGRVGVVGVEARTPVLTIDDDDLPEGTIENYIPKRSYGGMVGVVRGKFQDPAQLYQPQPYPEVADPTWSTEDNGEIKEMTLDLDFETNVERAQRIATLKANYERRQATLTGVYPFFAIELERGDWFVRTGATGSRFGTTGKTFEVMERIFDPKTFKVSILAQEVDPADSAWDETLASDPPPTPIDGTATLSAIEIPVIVVLATSLTGTASSVPALRIDWTVPTDPRVRWLYIEVENTDGTTPKTTKTIAIPSDASFAIFTGGVADGETYAVSAKFLTDTYQSDWCVAEIIFSDGTYAVGSAATVPWSGVTGTGKPADYATKNITTFSASAPSSPTAGDLWCDTSATPAVWKLYSSGAWQPVASLGGVFGSTLYEAVSGAVASLAAFKTLLGTAAAITSQGAFATLNSAAYGSGLLTGFGSLAALAFTTLGTNVRLADGTTSATDAILVTSVGTASAIAGQGSLATLSSLAYGGAYLTGFGSLAALAFVTLNTNVRRQDGTTAVTDATAITSLGTAAAIASQGDLATTNKAALPFGQNGLYDTDFMRGRSLWLPYWGGNTGTTITSGIDLVSGPNNWFGARHVIWANAAGMPAASTAFEIGSSADDNSTAKMMRVAAGDRIYFRAMGAYHRASNITLDLHFWDYAGAYIGSLTASGGLNNGGLNGLLSNFSLIEGYGAAPTNSAFCSLKIRVYCNGTDSDVYGFACEPMVMRVPAGQTATGLTYVPGGQDPLGDQTSLNTASAISGQGSLATLSFATLGTNVRLADGTTVATNALLLTSLGTAAAISGQGGLATTNFVLFNSTVRLADGTTVVTDAMVVTSSGTASGISGQGNQATSNSYYQSSAPSSPNNGDWWYDTTNSILKYRSSGAWQNVANFKINITASASPSSINEVHTGSSFSSGTITITPAGGTTYTYAVTFLKSGGAANVTLSANNASSFTATGTLTSGQDVTGGIIVDVFDSSGASCSIRIPLNFSRTD